jgi:hypothetical protein
MLLTWAQPLGLVHGRDVGCWIPLSLPFSAALET